jgi:hypothetical protein
MDESEVVKESRSLAHGPFRGVWRIGGFGDGIGRKEVRGGITNVLEVVRVVELIAPEY